MKRVKSVSDVLVNMARTFRKRNKLYGQNYLMVHKIIGILWPRGVPSALVTCPQWHLFELIIVKVSRLAVSNISHIDSVHDMAVYAAMIESIISTDEGERNYEQNFGHRKRKRIR
jgi:hypothetical protein